MSKSYELRKEAFKQKVMELSETYRVGIGSCHCCGGADADADLFDMDDNDPYRPDKILFGDTP